MQQMARHPEDGNNMFLRNGVISQRMEMSVTTVVRTSGPMNQEMFT
jgi:hypothetical protein